MTLNEQSAAPEVAALPGQPIQTVSELIALPPAIVAEPAAPPAAPIETVAVAAPPPAVVEAFPAPVAPDAIAALIAAARVAREGREAVPSTELVNLSFKVPSVFRAEFKATAKANDLSQVDFLVEAFELWAASRKAQAA